MSGNSSAIQEMRKAIGLSGPPVRGFQGKRSEASILIERRGDQFVHLIWYSFREAGSGPLVFNDSWNPDDSLDRYESEAAALRGAIERFERILSPAALKFAKVSDSKRAECAKMLTWVRGLSA